MLYVNIHNAKTNLSKYLEQVANQHMQIVICNKDKPVAILSEYSPPKKRLLGLWKGKIKIDNDFDILPENFMENFS